MKKLLSNSMLLTVLMLFTGVSASAYDFISDGIPYNILSEEDRTVSVTYRYEQYESWISGDVVIPKKLIYASTTYTVTAIGEHAFYNCKEMTSITLPNSLTEIGDDAFYNCNKITSVTLPNSLTSIGNYAFGGCTSLTSITLPNSLTKINRNAFIGCTNLENINVETGNNVYSSIDGALYDNGATTLIVCPRGKTSAPMFPETLTSIGDYAFSSCSSLASITLPNSLTSIGESAFGGCSSLASITLPNSLTSIGESAFYRCVSLTSITLPNSVTSIGNHAFFDCTSLTSITLPNSLTSIGESAFHLCVSLKSITLPNSLTSIGYRAFEDCTSLTSITLPNSLISIGESAFYRCVSLKSITLPNSLTEIGYEAFFDCTSLTSITLPNSLTSIGKGVFSGCTALENIMNQSAVPVECNPKFADEVLKNAVLYVPTGTLAEYEKVDPWRNFWNIEEMDFSSIEEIEAGNDSDIRLTVNGGVLTIEGLDGGENIAVYDMQGRCVYCGTDRCIDNLAAGIYIIRAGHKILKFAI